MQLSEAESAAPWTFACPTCRAPLDSAGPDALRCPADGYVYRCVDGIWRLLAPERLAYFAPFLRDYTAIRSAEGYGYDDLARYRRLPEVEASDPLAWQWRMRARSFAVLQKHVLEPMSRARSVDTRHATQDQAAASRVACRVSRVSDGLLGHSKHHTNLRVLDLGAGVSWLSNRLADLGHRPCAIDLNDDARDGLGAWRYYANQWPRLQAEFDRLPLADAQADLVIYNAALPYSADYRATLAEGLRVLRPGGRLVVMDSPIYRRSASGQAMVAERQAAFERQHGTRSDAVPSVGYLTWGMLRELGTELGLRWRAYTPWYGWRWALRPWRARLLRQREPSTFALLMAQRAGAGYNE